jgi:formate hydrogenlyase transcriptional activator
MEQPTSGVPAHSVENALIAAARALTSRLDVPGACLAVLDAVQDVFGSTSSWVLLHEPREGQLRTVAFRGEQADAFRDVVMPVDTGVMGLAFRSRQVVFVPNAQEDDRWFDVARVRRTGLRSVFAVPLVVQDRAVGVVGLDAPRYTSEHPPQQADVALFEALAAQAAIAIANAQLYETSERDRRRLTALLDERRSLRRRVTHLQEQVRAAYSHGDCIGESALWNDVVRLAHLVAAGDTTVLLLGETGTGKELLARTIHDQSPRSSGPFVAVNCAALPEGLVESELFGHEKGAFTNAVARTRGKFELADGGTLFLDEVGDLPGAAQAKLLRVLQDSQVERVGASAPVPVNVRIIAATNQDLEASIASKTYRSDLYFRLSVFPLRLPTLRDRASDIPLLARHFLRASARRLRRPATDLTGEAVRRLLAYPWPGNVRELQNVMERAAILTQDDLVPIEAIWLPNVTMAPTSETEEVAIPTLVEAERRAICAALDAAAWRISGAGGAADRLAMKPTTLHAKMKKLGVRRQAKGARLSK